MYRNYKLEKVHFILSSIHFFQDITELSSEALYYKKKINHLSVTDPGGRYPDPYPTFEKKPDPDPDAALENSPDPDPT